MLPLLAGSQYQQPIAVAATVAGARRALLERRFDLVLINTPMPDDFGTQLALDVCENTGSGVLLLVKAEHYPDINARGFRCAHGVQAHNSADHDAVAAAAAQHA